MIKNVIVIGLCSLLALEAVFPDVDLADLSHLPELVMHFQKHRQQSPDISFAEFLTLHYGNANHLTSTPADHQDLPFSKRQHHRNVLQLFCNAVLINPEATYKVIMKIERGNESVHLPRSITSQVWQPPRA